MISGWVLIALGIGMSLPVFLAAKGVLKPNGFLGIRTPSIRRSPEAWQDAHAAGAQIAVPVGFLVVLFGVGMIVDWPSGMAAIGDGYGLVGAFVIIIATIASARIAEKAVKVPE